MPHRAIATLQKILQAHVGLSKSRLWLAGTSRQGMAALDMAGSLKQTVCVRVGYG